MSDFKTEFLEHYLARGFGTLTKTDIDALVMHLIEKYGIAHSGPLRNKSNRAVSELVKASISRVRKIRHDAALRYGQRVEDEARARVLASLRQAAIEVKSKRVRLVIDDNLAREWLSATIQDDGAVVDGAFNRQIVDVSEASLIKAMQAAFGNSTAQQLAKQIASLRSSGGNALAKSLTKSAFELVAKAAIKECVGLEPLKALFFG